MACKFGNINYTSNKDYTKKFIQDCSQTLLESHLLIISKHKSHFMSNKTLFYSIKYINSILLNEYARVFIEPHVKTLLFDYMLPLFQLHPKEFQEFETDSHEYLQKELEKTQSVVFKRAAADLLIDLLKYRKDNDKTKDGDFIQEFLGMLNDCLDSIKNSTDQLVVLQREAVFYVLQKISDLVDSNQNFLNGINHMMENYVFPELSSPQDYMRARALLIYNAYSLQSFSDEHVHEAGRKVLENMTDNNPFPVQAIASTALGNFVGYNATIELFKEPLEHLLKTILDVID